MLYLTNTDLIVMETLLTKKTWLTHHDFYINIRNRSKVAITKSINSLLFCNVLHMKMIHYEGKLKQAFNFNNESARLAYLLYKFGRR